MQTIVISVQTRDVDLVAREPLVITINEGVRDLPRPSETHRAGASNEVGQFESGLTAQWFGAVPAVILGGMGTVLIVALWAWMFPELRRAGELSSLAPKDQV